MNRSHYVILFAIVFTVLFGNALISRAVYRNAVAEKEKIDNALQMAADTAGRQLARGYQNTNTADYLNAASDAFFRSLSGGLNLYEEPEAKEELTFFVPAILVSETGGFYINYLAETEEGGERVLERMWTECLPYAYSDDLFIYRFFLDDSILVYRKDTGERISATLGEIMGSPALLGKLSAGNVFRSWDSYYEYKRHAIAESIRKSLEGIVNGHSRIAGQYGVCAVYGIPGFFEDFTPAVEYPSFVAVFQGYPLSHDAKLVYSGASSSAAYITVARNYTVEAPDRLAQPFAVFHKDGCPYIGTYGRVLEEKWPMEAAVERFGAYACPH